MPSAIIRSLKPLKRDFIWKGAQEGSCVIRFLGYRQTTEFVLSDRACRWTNFLFSTAVRTTVNLFSVSRQHVMPSTCTCQYKACILYLLYVRQVMVMKASLSLQKIILSHISICMPVSLSVCNMPLSFIGFWLFSFDFSTKFPDKILCLSTMETMHRQFSRS